MKTTIRISTTLLLIILLFNTCSTTKDRGNLPKVPIAIVIKATDSDVRFANLNYYLFKLLDDIEDFQPVDLQVVEVEENPEILLTIDIESFTAWPKDERLSRQLFSRQVIIGQDVNGRPVYGIVRAMADIVQVRQRTDARFAVKLHISGAPGRNFERVFTPVYRYGYVYVANIQGDPRAVDPSVYAAITPPIEPDTYDLLMELSRQEMTRRIATEIRSYYSRKDKK